MTDISRLAGELKPSSSPRPWLRGFARGGYALRGVIYLVVGYFAALAATGSGETLGSRDALERLLDTAQGAVLAWLLAAGLVSYSLWRLVQAGLDADGHGHSAKALAIRAGLMASAVTYAALAMYVVSRNLGGGAGEEGGGFASHLASFVGAQWAAAAIAAALAGAGIAHFVKALRKGYERHLRASDEEMRFIHPVAQAGLFARGAIFLVLAFLFIRRAIAGAGTNDQPGTRQALDHIQSLPGGWLLLAATGMGLVAFAIYSFTLAWYRRINMDGTKGEKASLE